MRIDGNGRIAGPQTKASSTSPADRAARFSLEMGEAGSEAGATRATAPVSGLDAMLALQSVEDPTVRRRKLVRRGRSLLDALDSLKIGLLDGSVSVDDIALLSRLVREGRDRTDDPRLDSLLAEIDLRAAVELAKLERRNP
jgi:hypothetical protein